MRTQRRGSGRFSDAEARAMYALAGLYGIAKGLDIFFEKYPKRRNEELELEATLRKDGY
jgi:hypothetical protein